MLDRSRWYCPFSCVRTASLSARLLLCLALGLVVLFSLFTQQTADAASKLKPNFVFLLCEDLGDGDLSCFASPVTRKPNVD